MKIKNKEKVKELLARLTLLQHGVTQDTKSVADEIVNKEYADSVQKIKESSTMKMLSEVAAKLDIFKTEFNGQKLFDSISELEASLAEKSQGLHDVLDKKLTQLGKTGKTLNASLIAEISDLKIQISTLESTQIKIRNSIPSLTEVENRLDEITLDFSSRISAMEDQEVINWQKNIDELKKELLGQISSIGGGSMNRKINFNSTDFLTKYTDINYKAGANVTFTIANNNQTKMVDVTISATGGSGSGIVRSVNSISGSTSAGSAFTTDYVYLCTGTLTLTLPDATTNSNLYTVKNVGNGTITINTTSSQTIDGNLTITMPVQYTSVDLVSDTANWQIT